MSEMIRKAKYRVKNSEGNYEVVYLETSADQVECDAERQFVTEAEKTQFNENTVYTNDMPTVNSIGGIAAGTTFDNMPVNEVLTKFPSMTDNPHLKTLIESAVYAVSE